MYLEARREMLIAEITELTAALDARGFWITGSMGQDILNPALAARRAALEALRKLDNAPAAPADDPLADFMASAGA